MTNMLKQSGLERQKPMKKAPLAPTGPRNFQKTANQALQTKAMEHAKKRESIDALKDCTKRIAADFMFEIIYLSDKVI